MAHRQGITVGFVPARTNRYLDAAAGLPLHPVAVQAWLAAGDDGWADPSKLTGPGRRSAVLLDAARQSMAESLGVRADEVSFMPSGTHALQAGVLGVLAGRRRTGRELVHSSVEHSAVFKAADWHVAAGGTVRVVDVDRHGQVDQEQFLAAALATGVGAAVLQAANHEVGTRQPVEPVASLLAEAGVPLVVDASHAVLYGELPENLPVFSLDARLWGGPAGIGVLVIRRGVRWAPPFPVDDTEDRHSSGGVSVPDAVAAAASLRAFIADRSGQAERLGRLVDQVRTAIPRLISDAQVLGHPTDRLAHLVTFSCLYADGESLLSEFDRRGFVVSSGSSCTSDTLTPSHVLVAMGALTSGNVRVSLHPGVTESDVAEFLAAVPSVVAQVRAELPSMPESTASPPAGPDPAVIDSRGRRCPLPILDLARAMPGVAVGAVVTVLADDPAAASDIAAWCRMQGQEMLEATELDGGGTAYRVRRASPA
ncbi:MAG: cysteine desulfurase [Pseudonocardiales bacterium]|nr:cysteine desulfurase [Pseudonocardiales bacterium]